MKGTGVSLVTKGLGTVRKMKETGENLISMLCCEILQKKK